jgi:hypothetical protein
MVEEMKMHKYLTVLYTKPQVNELLMLIGWGAVGSRLFDTVNVQLSGMGHIKWVSIKKERDVEGKHIILEFVSWFQSGEILGT